jgi:hypothetical protein
MLLRRNGTGFVAALLLIGHFGPWVQHKSAALTLSAHELATFTNFTPNAGVFFNEGFLLPLWAAALLLLIPTRAAPVRRGIGWGVLALGIAALGLPGFPELRNLLAGRGSPFLPQLIMTLACMGLVVLLWLRPKLALFRVIWIGVIVVAAVPLGGFLMIKNQAIEVLYREPVGIGLGWWLTLISCIALGVIAFVTIVAAQPNSAATAPSR